MNLDHKKFDLRAPLWERDAFVEWVEARLALLRKQNDGDLEPAATARVRGQIAELKHLLALAAPQPPRAEPVGIAGEEI